MKWMPLCALLILSPLYANDELTADDIKTAATRLQHGKAYRGACLSATDVLNILAMPGDVAREMNKASDRSTTSDQISALKVNGPVSSIQSEMASKITRELRAALVNCKLRNNTRR